MFVAEHNLALSVMDHLPKLIMSAFPDSEIAKQIKCGRKRTTKLLTKVIAPYNAQCIADQIRSGTPYSLIIDETTDISSAKCLAIVLRFNQNGQTRDRFLQLVEMENLEAVAILNAVKKVLKEHNLPFNNMIAFAADNASVMMGKTGGVRGLLLKELPHLFVLGCICHSFALCSEAACEELPSSLEELSRNVFAYFNKSSKRRGDYRDYQTMASVKPHKLLKLSQTRWLSLEVKILRNCLCVLSCPVRLRFMQLYHYRLE